MKIKFILTILLGLISYSTYSQTNSLEQQFKKELQTQNKQVKSIQCQFKQTREVAVLSNKVNKEGIFYFVQPTNMLLSFEDGDFIKMTKDWFEMKTGKNVTSKKITSNPMLKNLSSIMSACVLGNFNNIGKGFSIEYKNTNKEWVLTLKPRSGKVAAKVSHIILSFDKASMTLNLLKMIEKSGDYTAYQFYNKQLNVAIDPIKFNKTKK